MTLEPMSPLQDGQFPDKRNTIDNLCSELREASTYLKTALHPNVAALIGDQVRLMNCYYSNLIEGHLTKPKDIQKALDGHFSEENEIRDLQLEAKAHIDLQKKIDHQQHGFENITTIAFIKWIHHEFYTQLPESLKTVTNEDTGEALHVVPGAFRENDVIVGRHVTVPHEDIEQFMNRFISRYALEKLGRHEQVALGATAHHRLLWIHPFLDGNGRVARLFSHAYLQEIGIGNMLWSVSRGLARNAEAYKSKLMAADKVRQGDLDGRGNLSLSGLQDFCIFFLSCCLDQIQFMNRLIDPQQLLDRIEAYTIQQINKGELHKKSFRLLSVAVKEGAFMRGEAGEILGVARTAGSQILSQLLKKGLLVSADKKAPVTLGIPDHAKEFWLPGLYTE